MTELSPGLALLAQSAPSLGELIEHSARAAASEAPILILGEPGTGRSTLARQIHATSQRAQGELVEVDAAAIPASLFESEFFGHRAGAFTGADKAVEGRLGRADGGSLLLDHVEEIPLFVQAKLLRLLSDGHFTPLGGGERSADVRFFAIGSDRLPERVQSGHFREDLFYRLEVVTLVIPPVRQRIGDLESLIGFFLSDLAQRFGRDALSLSSAAKRWMAKYSWPGNLRELRNVLEREVVLAEGRRATLDPKPPTGADEIPMSLADMEREQIKRALAYTRGHQGRAAEVLGISRKALWEKRKRYELP